MSSIEFIPAKTTRVASYTTINNSDTETTLSEPPVVSCFNKTIKQTVPLYFSAGTSNNKTEIACQFNDWPLNPALQKRCVTKEDVLKILNIYLMGNEDPTRSGLSSKKDPFRDSKYFSTETNQLMSITVPEDITKNIMADIKKDLTKLKILDLTNIDELNPSIKNNHETSNYPIFKQIIGILQDIQTVDTHSFPYKNIMSLADGSSFLSGTALRIKKATRGISDDIQITSADLASTGRSRIYIERNGTNRLFNPKKIKKHYNIKIINLDNTLPFTSQLKKLAQKKYDLIVMDKGLCVCTEDLACGGIQPSQKGSLYGLLINVASILDTSKSHSLAVLTGQNSYYNIELWNEEIQQFNIDNQGKLVAEAARDRAEIFQGITIKVVNPDSERSKRCSIL